MASRYFFYSLALFHTALASSSNTTCAPGGNFDLSKFKLQLPSGSSGHPDSVSSSELDGCEGYHDKYFFTSEEDGSLTMKVPGSPETSTCVTTANSKHCRTELRESSPASWSPAAPANRLRASLVVADAGGSTCIGQIHIDDAVSVRPVAELYYGGDGEIEMGVAQTRAGGDQKRTTVGHVAPGTRFSYEIRYEGGELSVQIDGGEFQKLSTYELDGPDSYFKVGNYLQGSSASEVRFYSIEISHSDEVDSDGGDSDGGDSDKEDSDKEDSDKEDSSSSSDSKREVRERSHSRDVRMWLL